jgi:hypothetical protein
MLHVTCVAICAHAQTSVQVLDHEHDVENVLLVIFFCMLSKRDTRLNNTRLPLHQI